MINYLSAKTCSVRTNICQKRLLCVKVIVLIIIQIWTPYCFLSYCITFYVKYAVNRSPNSLTQVFVLTS
jgi:hypothetical protein